MERKVKIETPFEKARTMGAKDKQPRKGRGIIVSNLKSELKEIEEKREKLMSNPKYRESIGIKTAFEISAVDRSLYNKKLDIERQMKKAEVKPFFRTRRGKIERVHGFSRRQAREAFAKEQEEKRRLHQIRLDRVNEAIGKGEVYLDTAFGFYKVTGYRDDTGWAVTHPAGQKPDWANQRSFMVTVDELEGPSQERVRERLLQSGTKVVEIERPFVEEA